jgi:phospholipase C
MSQGVVAALASVSAMLAQTVTGLGSETTHFQHIVVIVQENRTPDNLFYGLCSPPYGTASSCSTTPSDSQYNIQADHWANWRAGGGYTNPGPVPLANAYDLSHAHSAFIAMCNANPATGKCSMNGAIDVPCSGTCPSTPQYKYVDNSKGVVSPYLDLATQYGWANYMFQTNQGPSFPAHQFIFGGTSAPSASDDAKGTFASENMNNTGIGGTDQKAGCIADSGTTVQLINAYGIEDHSARIYPCFEHKTIADILEGKHSWRYYAPNAGSIWTAPNAIRHICDPSSGTDKTCEGTLWKDNVDLNPPDVLTDIKDCHLRDVSWVIPSGANSDHAKGNDGGGPSWVASIVNAIGDSSRCDGGSGYWKNTAIVVTWDDWGGWYDHVAPTILPYPQGGYQLGFRVPLLVISAYTPKHYINNDRHDFGTILRFIEYNFTGDQGQLGFADARADSDLRLFFDFSRPARNFQNIAATLSADDFLNDKRPATDPDDQ